MNEHGIFVAAAGNVWLVGNGEKDHQILKFTRDGRFLMQIGKPASSGGDADIRNLAEVDSGKRVQKFVYQGLFPVTD